MFFLYNIIMGMNKFILGINKYMGNNMWGYGIVSVLEYILF